MQLLAQHVKEVHGPTIEPLLLNLGGNIDANNSMLEGVLAPLQSHYGLFPGAPFP